MDLKRDREEIDIEGLVIGKEEEKENKRRDLDLKGQILREETIGKTKENVEVIIM